jgi:hypothetical protein
MNWLKRALRNWLHSDLNAAEVGLRAGGPGPLSILGSMDNPSALMVTPIDNGFLIINRKYNPNGPDSVTAMFVADAESLSAALINRLAQSRLKI